MVLRLIVKSYDLIFSWLLARRFPTNLLAALQNFRFGVAGSTIRFTLVRGGRGDFGSVKEAELTRYFSNARRGLDVYRSGIVSRGDFVFDSYRLGNIDFQPDDFVVDCGANYGDLWIALRDKIQPTGYIAIEPNPIDCIVLEKNLPGSAVVVRSALGSSAGRMDFFLSTQNGDSSLIEPLQYDTKIRVDVVSLDQLMEQLGISSVKLLKLEAEGFEPEVLSGASQTIKSCHWVAADGFYERGILEEQTFTQIVNFLARNSFDMVDIYLPWGRALFRNRDI